MKRVFGFLVVAGILAGIAYAGLRIFGGSAVVETVKPSRGKAVEAVYATGTVEPVYWAKLSVPSAGQITEILRDEGEKVKKGEVIARLDDRVQRADVARYQAEIKKSIEELKRQKELRKMDFSSRRLLEQAQADYENSLASLDAAKKQLADREITSPLEGEVLRKLVELGEFVKEGEPLFWVGKPEPLQVVAEVDEEDIPKVFVDQEALIKADAFANRVIEGKVSKIIPKGDPVTKIFLVEVSVPADSRLLVGMTTEVNFIAAVKENALQLPVTAVLDGTVWKLENGKASPQEVKTGITDAKSVEIVEGVGESDMVINPFPQGLKPGQSVKERH